MEGQMTIFDFLGDYSTMTDEEIAKTNEERIGIKFMRKKGNEYIWKRKKLVLTFEMLTDWEGKSFISVGWDVGLQGGGYPIYSIDKAGEWYKYILELYGEDKDGQRQSKEKPNTD